MEQKTSQKKAFDLKGYGKAVTFLLLEILAVVSFSLGGSFVFYSILSLVILVLIILVSFSELKKGKCPNAILFLIPLVSFGVISILSYFRFDPYFVLGNSPVLAFVPIAFICFAASGYLINITGSFKIHTALIVIYSSLALLTFINLIATMIQFVPFYSLRYSNYYYYYNGAPSPEPIGKMAYFLMGFSVTEVSLSYFSYYPMMLLTAFLPLGHMSFKDNRKLYLLYLGFGILGLLAIVLTINKITLLVLFGVAILIGLIAIFDKFNINRKPLKIITIVASSLLVIGFIFVLLNAQDSVGIAMRNSAIRKLTTGNPLLNKLFNSNRFFSAYDSILDGLFAQAMIDGSAQTIKLFGFPIHGNYVNVFGEMTWKLTDSNSFLFDSFFESGLFGTLFLIVILVVGLRKVIQYYNLSDDDKKDKVMVLAFVIISLAYALVNYDATPYIFTKTTIPFYLNSIFLIDLFLFGYCFFKVENKPEEKASVEEVINNEEEI